MNNNGGMTNIDVLSVGALYVGGKRFRDIIRSLISEDLLEQQEITDLRNLLLYLNTTGLNQSWVVNNDNRNAVLKSLITAIETKLNFIDTTALSQSSVLNNDNRNSVLKTAIDNLITKLNFIDTTALSQSSVLTNDNRNSVLKTRIDGNDGSLTDLTNKTRYIQDSSVGNNSADPKTANSLIINVNSNPSGIQKGDLRLFAGTSVFRMQNEGNTLDYNKNQIQMLAPIGMITSDAHLNRMMASDKIEIGNLGTQSQAAINIGGKGAQINIGSIDTPAIGETNTIITIGKRTVTRNTETYHKGNQYIAEARFEDLPVTTGISISNIIDLLSASKPVWILAAFTSTAGGFNYSDILHMNLSNPLQKNKDITTSKGITIDSFKLFDTNPIALFPKSSTYLVAGDIVSTQVVGNHQTAIFSGKIKMEVHNTLNPLNINWALTEDDDNVNVVDIKGDDGIFIHQGASQVNQPLRIINSCGSGGIELKVGGSSTEPFNRGRKQHAVGGLFLRQSNQLNCAITKLPPDESIFAFKRKTNNNNAKVDYRLLVSCNDDEPASILNNGAQNNHGIVVYNEAKHQAIDNAAIANSTQPVYTEYTTIDEDNVTTPSLTFLGNYSGPTANTLYKNANNDLMYDGQPVAVGSIAASGGGLTYVITNPATATITSPNYTPITNLTMSSTYTSSPLRTATLSSYVVNTNYRIVSIIGEIPKAANPILSGTYELNQFVNYTASVAGSLYAKLYFTGLPLSGGTILINKVYTSPAGSFNNLTLTTPEIKVPANDVNITISSVTFPQVSVGGSQFGTTGLVLTLIDQTSTILYTFPLINANNNGTFDRVFAPASPVTITDTTNITSLRFVITSQNPNTLISQASALNATNASYYIEGSSIRMLLYNGTSNPSTLAHNTTAIYALSLPLPTTPFVITDFINPNITLEEWFIQPSGSTSNHNVALQFNDGGLSHLHTSISTITTIPTLSSVMAVGNSVGTNSLNMNNQSINNCSVLTAATITPNAITGWNVKSLTAGSGITAVNNNGTWTITNTGILVTPTLAQVLTQGNTAESQNISGINTLTATTITPTNITGWNVKNITGAGGIVVSNNGAGTYLISSDSIGGYEASTDDYSITAASSNTARKPSWYGNTFNRVPAMANTNTTFDIYMSVNGKIIAVAQKDSNDDIQRPILYSNDFGTSYNPGNISKNWLSICGTTLGEAIYAIQGRSTSLNSIWPREIWRSTNRGATWTQQTSPPDFSNSTPTRIRCSGDGKFQLVNDTRTGALGKLYKSNDYGASWTSVNITTATSRVISMAISATGHVQYLVISGTSQLTTADQNNGGIYRSLDFGATWAYIYTTGVNDILSHIDCDATGRIVVFSNAQGVFSSRNYGNTWSAQISITGANNISISPNGNIIWVACIGVASSTAQLFYSDDYGHTFTARNQTPDGSYQSTAYQAIATNNDGTIVVGGGQFNLNSCRQFTNEVAQIAGGVGISITVANGSYTISTSTTIDLWFSGSLHLPYVLNGSTTFEINWLTTMGRIDLSLYDIRYEIDIHWDSNTTAQTWNLCFFELGLNAQLPSAFTSSGIIHSSVTNWQNEINNGSNGGANLYNSTYNNRFYCGYSAQQNTHSLPAEPMFRHKTMLSGELSMKRRTAVQAGFNDTSINSRTIINKFNSDNYLENNYTGTGKWGIWANTTPDDTFQHIRVHGTALWNLSYGDAWTNFSGTNEAISQGVYNLLIRMRDNATTNPLSRSARVDYRIYRIKK